MAMAENRKTDFERRVAEVRSPKSDINSLILDYLTMEGYPKAAAKFSKEANLQPQQEGDSIETRQQIQHSIHSGRIQESIDALNEYDPEILDGDPALHFSLLRLQLVELIRSGTVVGDISTALDFATSQLGPRAPTHPKFLEQLEQTMSLIIFPHESLEPQTSELLHPDLRRQVADDVNRAILQRQTDRRDAAIRQLVKLRAWAEETARDEGKALPASLDLGLGSEDAHENGHDPMVTS